MTAQSSSHPTRPMGVRELARFYAFAFGLIAVCSVALCALASHLIWNCTPSLPSGLYWLSHGTPATKGALVAFPVPAHVAGLVQDRRYLPPHALLVKPVVALAGDRVCTDDGALRVNGALLGQVLVRDSLGRSLPRYAGCGALPDGQLFVASHYAQSFDSRTFGPLHTSDLRGTVTPLWTF